MSSPKSSDQSDEQLIKEIREKIRDPSSTSSDQTVRQKGPRDLDWRNPDEVLYTFMFCLYDLFASKCRI
jgi:hypothetical protein